MTSQRRIVVGRVDASVGMLASPRSDDSTEDEALFTRIGGIGMCRPEPWAAGRRVVALPAQVRREMRRERGRMHDVLDHREDATAGFTTHASLRPASAPRHRSMFAASYRGKTCAVGSLVRVPAGLVLVLVVAVVVSGCGNGDPRMHSVRDVRATFARHGLKLSIMDRTRVSTMLLPTPFVRAVRRTPAVGTPPRAPSYQVVVFTDRRWLRDLPRHERDARAALGGGPRFSDLSKRHDNVFIVYFGGPAPRARLEQILDDIA